MRRHRTGRLFAVAIAVLLALAIPASAAIAGEAGSEGLGEQIDAATRAAERTAEQAARSAQRAGAQEVRATQKVGKQEARATQKAGRQEAATQQANRKQKRQAEKRARLEARREASRKRHEAIPQARKEKEGNKVAIGCTNVTTEYRQFNAVAGKPNEVEEWIAVKNSPESISKEPIKVIVTFEGAAATSVVNIPFPVGHYLVDVHAKWNTNGRRGNFDIHGNVTCAPKPAFTVTKLQSIEGSGKPLTSETLSGTIGQVVDYQITATNAGNTPLTFTTFLDKECNAGTIHGGSQTPVEPLETVTYTCRHTITAADEKAGAIVNVAKITASPEQNEGAAITHESNAVVVAPIAAQQEAKKEEPKNEEPKKEEPKTEELKKEEPKHEESPLSSPAPGPSSTGAPAATPTATIAKGGVLGFTSASVPSLKGPQGCVRGDFTASIRATGVSGVTFYLDGRRIARLTYRNAHRGLLSVRINPASLRVGVHRLLAQITMKQSSPSAQAARAARRLTVIRCGSSVITPKFTG